MIFLKQLSGLQKLHFPLKEYMERLYGLNLVEHFLQIFFHVFFFLRPRRKYTEKKPPKNSANKIQVKSGEIPVLKNLGKTIRNIDSRTLTSKSAKLTCNPILKSINTGKDFKTLKNKFNRYGGQVGSSASGKKY